MPSTTISENNLDSFLEMLHDVNKWILAGNVSSTSRAESERKRKFLDNMAMLSQDNYLKLIEVFFENEFKDSSLFASFYYDLSKKHSLPRLIDRELEAAYVMFTFKCQKNLPLWITEEEELLALLTGTLPDSETTFKATLSQELFELLDSQRIYELISNVSRLRYLIDHTTPISVTVFNLIFSALKMHINGWVTNENLVFAGDSFIALLNHKNLDPDMRSQFWDLIRTSPIEWIFCAKDYSKFIKSTFLASDEFRMLDFIMRISFNFHEWMLHLDDLEFLFEPIKNSNISYEACWIRVTTSFCEKPALRKFNNILSCKHIREDDRNAFKEDIFQKALRCNVNTLETWLFLLESPNLSKEQRELLFRSFKDKAPSLNVSTKWDLSINEVNESECDYVESELDDKPLSFALKNTVKVLQDNPFRPSGNIEENNAISSKSSSTQSLSEDLEETPSLLPITNLIEFTQFWKSNEGLAVKKEDIFDEKGIPYFSWITSIGQIIQLFNDWNFTNHLTIADDIKTVLVNKSLSLMTTSSSDTIQERVTRENFLAFLQCKQLSDSERLDILQRDMFEEDKENATPAAEYFLKNVKDVLQLLPENDMKIILFLTNLMIKLLNDSNNSEELLNILKHEDLPENIKDSLLMSLNDDFIAQLIIKNDKALAFLLNDNGFKEKPFIDKLVNHQEWTCTTERLDKYLAENISKNSIQNITTLEEIIQWAQQLKSLYDMQLVDPNLAASQGCAFFSKNKSVTNPVKLGAIAEFLNEIDPLESLPIDHCSNSLVAAAKNKGRIGLLHQCWMKLGQPTRTSSKNEDDQLFTPR